MITSYNQGWELLKECMKIISENEKKWAEESEQRKKQKENESKNIKHGKPETGGTKKVNMHD